MKKLIEIHLGHVGRKDVDANLDIYIEVSETSALYKNAGIMATRIADQLAPLNYNGDAKLAPAVLGVNVTNGENIAELFRGYFGTDSVKTCDKETVEDLEIYAYAKCGEFDALAEHPVVTELCECVNGALSGLCDKVGKITGKDMSYYEELTEIEPALFAYMHPQTAVNIIREQYLTYAEILIAIAKEALSESEDWL